MMKRHIGVGKNNSDEEIAIKTSSLSIAVNTVLSAFKMISGFTAGSSAMISDGVHSLSDLFSTVIVMIGVKVSSRDSDSDHRYGHERLECVAAIILAVILALTGFGIGAAGVKKIIDGAHGELSSPGALALVAAGVSIVVKEWMFRFVKGRAKKINSTALMAEAWHHRSDALSSVGTFIGVFGARLGAPILDPIASVVVCGFIVKAAFDIFKDATDRMVDKSCDDETVGRIRQVILNQDGVVGIDLLNTRLFGSKIYVDVEISADGRITFAEAHDTAERVHAAIEENFPAVKHCMVHVNPVDIAEKELER